MIRIMVVLWSVLATGVGVSLFLLKHEVQSLEDDLDRINRSVRTGEESIHVLQAEWAFLNDPPRLRRLAETHLHMTPTLPRQITTIAALPSTTVVADAGSALAPAPRPLANRSASTRVSAAPGTPTVTATPTAYYTAFNGSSGASGARSRAVGAVPPLPVRKPQLPTRTAQANSVR
ncbi:MAG: hypothetical protein ABT940_08540 [Alphaproteobacteria bacterium]